MTKDPEGGSRASSCAASSAVKMPEPPVPMAGLTSMGNPIFSAALRTADAHEAMIDRGTGSPAASAAAWSARYLLRLATHIKKVLAPFPKNTKPIFRWAQDLGRRGPPVI